MNDLEYFDRSIDEQKSKTDKKLIGTEWYTSRYVSRVGYKYEPLQMDGQDVVKKAIELLENDISYPLYSQTDLGREKADSLAHYIVSRMVDKNRPLPLYRARGELCQEMNKKESGPKWRRIWFIDFEKEWPHQAERMAKIIDIKNTWTGEYYPPSSWGEDYEPGGLSPAFYQSIYLCQFYVFTAGRYWHADKMAYLHPLDMKQQLSQESKVGNYEW